MGLPWGGFCCTVDGGVFGTCGFGRSWRVDIIYRDCRVFACLLLYGFWFKGVCPAVFVFGVFWGLLVEFGLRQVGWSFAEVGFWCTVGGGVFGTFGLGVVRVL